MQKSIEYRCLICDKDYKTYQTLWKHNKKFHNNEKVICQDMSSKCQDMSSKCQDMSSKCQDVSSKCQDVSSKCQDVSSKCQVIVCENCNKQFNTRQAKSLHKKKCKIFTNELDKLNAENKQKELSLLLLKEEKEILKLKLKLEKSNKIDNITLKKLNKKFNS
jgi:hypothetical protein